MRGIFHFIYYVLTAPLRLFGRSRGFRWLVGSLAVLAIFFTATLWALDRFMPAGSSAKQAVAKLPQLPPLPPMTRASFVIAPVAISIDAIQRTLEAFAPRQLSGKADNPISSLLSKADIGMTINRGNIALNGKPNELTALTQLDGTLKITGQLACAGRQCRRQSFRHHRQPARRQFARQRCRQGRRRPDRPRARPERRSAQSGDRAGAPVGDGQLALAA